jgi:type II secretory pathway component PulF
MTSGMRKAFTVAATVGAWILFDAVPALAQLVESDVDAQPGVTQTTQLVTSSTEVRRAVVALLGIAAAAGLIFVLYWYKTGQQARQRFARQYAGRHADAAPSLPRRRRR